MKTKVIYLFMLGLVGFTACEKETNRTKETADQPSLVELAENEQDNFLVNGNKIDNTEIFERYMLSQQDRSIIWRPFPSGWGWDCVGCFGLCSVNDPFPFPGEPVPFPFPWESIGHNAVGGVIDAGAEGLKLQLYPKPSELSCAITGDGFFPIKNGIPLSEGMCSIMELPIGTFIEAGIYTANADETGAYSSITLNLSF